MEEFIFGSLREKNANRDKGESSLKEWLEYIFPGDDIVYDSSIPKEIWSDRCDKYSNVEVKYERFRPDARIESLGVVIEFNGPDHYRVPSVMLQDANKEVICKQLGYKVVQIPYFVQLNPETVKYYFDVEITDGCDLPSGFYSTSGKDIDLNPYMPACFCSMGWNRFTYELKQLPEITRYEIINSLLVAQLYYERALVIPLVNKSDHTAIILNPDVDPFDIDIDYNFKIVDRCNCYISSRQIPWLIDLITHSEDTLK